MNLQFAALSAHQAKPAATCAPHTFDNIPLQTSVLHTKNCNLISAQVYSLLKECYKNRLEQYLLQEHVSNIITNCDCRSVLSAWIYLLKRGAAVCTQLQISSTVSKHTHLGILDIRPQPGPQLLWVPNIPKIQEANLHNGNVNLQPGTGQPRKLRNMMPLSLPTARMYGESLCVSSSSI